MSTSVSLESATWKEMCSFCYDPSEMLIPGKTLSFKYDASGTKCWNKDGYKWKFMSAYATFISSSLDSSIFFVQKEMRKDSFGSPEIREYFEKGFVLIAIRENNMRSSEVENTVVMYK